MDVDYLTRRLFLQGSASTAFAKIGVAGLVAIAESACTARNEGAEYSTLSQAEGREFEAIAARILPATDTPGAREAGVIWFMDKAFGTFAADQLDTALGGLEAFQTMVPDAFPGATRFSDLDVADQDRHLETQENTEFFGLMRFLTVLGFFGMNKYGGNRDDAGWKLLGVGNEHHGWQPPFGYYDAEYVAASRSSGEQHGE
jgi:gluconate 2-dehydrogenase gamma chain